MRTVEGNNFASRYAVTAVLFFYFFLYYCYRADGEVFHCDG